MLSVLSCGAPHMLCFDLLFVGRGRFDLALLQREQPFQHHQKCPQ